MVLRDSSVGIVTAYGLDDRGGGSSNPGRKKIFTSPYRPDRLWGPPGTGSFFPEVKRQGREADHSPGSIHPLPHTFSWRNA
jgi:hypothetical protein